MNYADEQRSPTRHIIGFSIVVLLHVALIYALINGLGHNIVDIIKQPLETKIIKDTKPPPPEAPPPPPPTLATPPPPYVPPPDFQIQQPTDSHAITEVTHEAPPTAELPRTQPTAAAPAVPDSSVSARPIAGAPLVYPPELEEGDDEREGRVSISCDVDVNGTTSNCDVNSVQGGSPFAREALNYVRHARYRPAIHNGVPVAEPHHTWELIFKAPQ